MNGSKNKTGTESQRLAGARLLRIVKKALKAEGITTTKCSVTLKPGEIVLNFPGRDVDKFLAREAVHNHTALHAK